MTRSLRFAKVLVDFFIAIMKAKNTQNFQTVGLIGRTRLTDKTAFLLKLKKYLEENKKTLLWDNHMSAIYGDKQEHTVAHILKNADLVLTLGGDGTILKILRDLPKRKDLFICGINLGNVGFNTEIRDPKKTLNYLDEFFKGEYHVDERLILRATLYRNGKKISTHTALNDVVINQGNFARLISLRAEIDQRKMISFKSDGVILATPTGSTGHSLSAGGPIIHPRIEAFIFTPICPAVLSVRPIVIPANRQITVTLETERRYKDNTIGLTIDGQIVLPLQYGDQIKIRRSSRRLRFIRKATGGGSYYRLLRDSLSWGKTA
ncbi:NAD(+)/NADH kinase [Patescibacteria group bacterium]|nr:NAD(+)/NADH kinase [Patescibacteria group bacterium]